MTTVMVMMPPDTFPLPLVRNLPAVSVVPTLFGLHRLFAARPPAAGEIFPEKNAGGYVPPAFCVLYLSIAQPGVTGRAAAPPAGGVTTTGTTDMTTTITIRKGVTDPEALEVHLDRILDAIDTICETVTDLDEGWVRGVIMDAQDVRAEMIKQNFSRATKMLAGLTMKIVTS